MDIWVLKKDFKEIVFKIFDIDDDNNRSLLYEFVLNFNKGDCCDTNIIRITNIFYTLLFPSKNNRYSYEEDTELAEELYYDYILKDIS